MAGNRSGEGTGLDDSWHSLANEVAAEIKLYLYFILSRAGFPDVLLKIQSIHVAMQKPFKW